MLVLKNNNEILKYKKKILIVTEGECNLWKDKLALKSWKIITFKK